MSGILKVSDLTALREACLTSKQRNLLWYKDKLYSIDNTSCITCMHLPFGSINYYPLRAIEVNTRELSAVVKQFTTEPDFELESLPAFGYYSFIIDVKDLVYEFKCDNYNDDKIHKFINTISSIDNALASIEDIDVSSNMRDLALANKTIGTVFIDLGHEYKMYMPSNSLPLGKNDRIHAKILDDNPNTFTVKFSINKKNYLINTYMSFLKLK